MEQKNKINLTPKILLAMAAGIAIGLVIKYCFPDSGSVQTVPE